MALDRPDDDFEAGDARPDQHLPRGGADGSGADGSGADGSGADGSGAEGGGAEGGGAEGSGAADPRGVLRGAARG